MVVLPTTTDDLENILPVEVFIKNTPETSLDYLSKILLNYPFILDKGLHLEEKMRVVSSEIMAKVEKARQIAFSWEQ